MGHDEDNPYHGVVEVTPLEGQDCGYQMKDIVVRHPDGKFYKFTYYYDDDGMTRSSEYPEDEFPAVEVKCVEEITYTYVPVE